MSERNISNKDLQSLITHVYNEFFNLRKKKRRLSINSVVDPIKERRFENERRQIILNKR